MRGTLNRSLHSHLEMFLFALLASTTTGRVSFADPGPKVGEPLARRGDEIVACGQLFHTTAPIVLWTDPGGYDAYRVELKFSPWDRSAWPFANAPGVKRPNRFGLRKAGLSENLLDKVRGGGWDLPSLQKVVDQFVIHFDVCGTSRKCFEVLHDQRGLSIHLMLDVDGTIYQTLDLKEGAWHATIANGRSIGIEIANIGAYPVDRAETLKKWYQPDEGGHAAIVLPNQAEKASIRNKEVGLRPIREEPVRGNIQGSDLLMYDLTPQQYDSLIKLTATLCTVFPRIRCDYPHDEAGKLKTRKLPDAEYTRYQGVLGHYHVQTNKVDPGPAFQWDRVTQGAKKLMDAR